MQKIRTPATMIATMHIATVAPSERLLLLEVSETSASPAVTLRSSVGPAVLSGCVDELTDSVVGVAGIGVGAVDVGVDVGVDVDVLVISGPHSATA